MNVPYGLIYLTSRVEDGVVKCRYIGQHKLTGGVIEDGYLGSGTLLRRAIAKYGRDCFAREVLQLCYSREELNLAEIKWIKQYDAAQSQDFYNLAYGGDGGLPECKIIHRYELTGEFIDSYPSIAGAASKFRTSAMTLGIACKGKGRTGGGFQWRFEKVKRLSSVEIGNKRAVSCYDLDGNFICEFPGVKEAGIFCKRSGANICAACNGQRASVGNFQWKYSSSDKQISKKLIQKKTTRGMFQIDPKNGEKLRHFVSSTIAGETLGIRAGSLSGAANNGYLCGGYLWQYDDVLVSAIELRKNERKEKKEVLCFTNEGKFLKKFSSAKEGADYFGICRRRVSTAACETNRVKTAAGHFWYYV